METQMKALVTKEKDVSNADTICASMFGVKREDIYRKTRIRNVVMARHLHRYLWYALTRNPYLFERLGLCDRTSVLWSARVINNLCDTDKEVRRKVKYVEMLYGVKIHHCYVTREYIRDCQVGNSK